MVQNTPDGHSTSDRVWDIVLKALVPVSILLAGSLVSHEVRLAKIEESRFTERDASLMERRIIESIPPPWLKAQIEEIKALLRENTSRLRAVEQSVK